VYPLCRITGTAKDAAADALVAGLYKKKVSFSPPFV